VAQVILCVWMSVRYDWIGCIRYHLYGFGENGMEVLVLLAFVCMGPNWTFEVACLIIYLSLGRLHWMDVVSWYFSLGTIQAVQIDLNSIINFHYPR
jgi:hypothetical protein